MDFGAFKRELLKHYIAMAGQPAFKAHAWHQVNEFADKYPREFADLPELLTKAMNSQKEPK